MNHTETFSALDAGDLIEIARKANHEGDTAKVERILRICSNCLRPKEKVAQPNLLTPLSAAPTASDQQFSSREQIHHCMCELLRKTEIGSIVSFSFFANYIESQPDLKLDRSIISGDHSQVWRRHITKSIEKLRSFGCLARTEYSRGYILTRLP
jgi:hypothetical protein